MSEPVFDAQDFLASAARTPGVYRMYDAADKTLYIGKAKDLKARLSSYFRAAGLATKTIALVAKIAKIECTLTNSEAEALVLEQNLIKELRPPYNILLRDDKSYPYVYISKDRPFPRLAFYRGRKRPSGDYFGPYPSSGAIRESLSLLQKVFKVRQCDDSVFKNRSRPCLQYQIKRCKAPCTQLVSKEEYAEDVLNSRLFLQGKSQQLIYTLIESMEEASGQLDFERAAELRDQINMLRSVQEQQVVEGQGGDIDAVALARAQEQLCFVVLFVREGRVLGHKSYLQRNRLDSSDAELLSQFVSQYYLNSAASNNLPSEIILSTQIDDQACLEDVFSAQYQQKIEIRSNVRSDRRNWLKLAHTNAQHNLKLKLAAAQSLEQRFADLQALLNLDYSPQRLECFDISHSSGEATVASCVVFDQNGAKKSDYRRFNIKGITAGDDYAAMHQALERRYSRVIKEEGALPDILFVDGGKGQLSMAADVLKTLGLSLRLVGVAKGSTRKAGFETLIVHATGAEINLNIDSPALQLVQSIRDESHRFAITGHRARRDKTRRTSTLEDIEGIGAKRRQALLKFFGGLQGVQQASAHELAKVQGISQPLAAKIHEALHPQ